MWLVWDSKSDWDTREAKVRHFYNWQKNSLNRCDVRNLRSESASDFSYIFRTETETQASSAWERGKRTRLVHIASDPCFIPVGSFFSFLLVPRKAHFRIWVNFTPHKMLHRENARKHTALLLLQLVVYTCFTVQVEKTMTWEAERMCVTDVGGERPRFTFFFFLFCRLTVKQLASVCATKVPLTLALSLWEKRCERHASLSPSPPSPPPAIHRIYFTLWFASCHMANTIVC